MRNMFLAVLAFAGLTACAPDVVLSPITPDFVVAFDTGTVRLETTSVGAWWGFGLQATVTGTSKVASDQFVVSVDHPNLVQVVRREWRRTDGYSNESRAPTVTFDETIEVLPIAAGTATITFYHPSDSRKKRTYVMPIAKMPEVVPTKGD